jgi:uncharacterized protein YjbJ (UPF0337 family)
MCPAPWITGEVKETVGDATDDRDLQAEGQADQTKGNLKQAGEKIKDAFPGLTSLCPAGSGKGPASRIGPRRRHAVPVQIERGTTSSPR